MISARILIDTPPFAEPPRINAQVPWNAVEQWPCRWIRLNPPAPGPAVVAYRCRFDLPGEKQFRLHVTADESYELFIDGESVGIGSDRGDAANWFFDTYEIQLPAGRHVIAAVVKALRELRPAAVVSVCNGLLVAPEDQALLALIGTGVSAWEAAVLQAVSLSSITYLPNDVLLIGPSYQIDYRQWPQNWYLDERLDWSPVGLGESGNDGLVLNPGAPIHLLRPSMIPSQARSRLAMWKVRRLAPPDSQTDAGAWESVLAGHGAMRLDAEVSCTVLLDAQDYVCGIAELDLDGGRDAEIELTWAEVIRSADGKKGNRDFIDGPVAGVRDSFIADGMRRRICMPVWRSGRYLQVRIRTGSQPMTVHDIAIYQTGYPLNPQARWETGDAELNRLFHICQRTQQACAHDTFMDCPFYEQLQYIGDTRIQALLVYCLSSDARLVTKAIELFLSSRLNPSHLPLACAPTNSSSIIPPFALWLAGMIRDYAWWRGDAVRVRTWLPALRATLDVFLAMPRSDGLIRSPFGWNFLDGSLGQIVPGGMPGEVSGPLNWQLVLALQEAADLEAAFGEIECSDRYRRHAAEIAAALDHQLYRPALNLYSDVPGDNQFSEHGQILPLLTNALSPERRQQVSQGLLGAHKKKPAAAFFEFYQFEVYQKLGRGDLILDRLAPWKWAVSQGFKAFPEYIQVDTRSDCHAWSAHPLYHYFATLLGIRPGSWGFKTVRIAPQPGILTFLNGTIAHPAGLIHVELNQHPGRFEARIDLPPGLTGEFLFRGNQWSLRPGKQHIAQ